MIDPITYPEYPIDDAITAMRALVLPPLKSIHITIREEGIDIRLIDKDGELHIGNTYKGKAMPSAIMADAMDQFYRKEAGKTNIGLYARRDALQAEIDEINKNLWRLVNESSA